MTPPDRPATPSAWLLVVLLSFATHVLLSVGAEVSTRRCSD